MKILRKIKNSAETNKPLSRCFDRLAKTSAYKKIVSRKMSRHIADIEKNKKYNVIVETTNICNASCVMCPHAKMKREKEVMTDGIFELILKKIKVEKISPLVFLLNGFGEPLTDKKIFSRIKLAKKEFPLSMVKFCTNLSLANEETIGKMMNCGLDEVNVSFNGLDENSYEKTMRIGYAKTLRNLESLIDARNKAKSPLKIRLSLTLVSHNDGSEKKVHSRMEKQG